jgi:peptide chain release factor 1
MDLTSHLDRFRRRFAELENELARPDLYANPQRAQELTREHARLKQVLADGATWTRLNGELAQAEEMARNTAEPEMAEMAQEELAALRPAQAKAEQAVRFAIVPPDENDSRNTIVEIRAGVGGDEAALFAAELARMYTRYAERVGWKTETLDLSPSDKGGLKEIIFQVNGTDVFKKIRYESGVHRVQRVPATEAQGRVHTSPRRWPCCPRRRRSTWSSGPMSSRSASAARAVRAARGSTRPIRRCRSPTCRRG